MALQAAATLEAMLATRMFDQDAAHGNRRGGHYELRNTQQWVPGATTQVWVNGFCHRPPFSPVQVCTQGRYENRTSPGYYRTVQEWVWVEHHRRGNRWGRR